MAKRGILAQCRFCPWCGCETIERDVYGDPRTQAHKCEWICTGCGSGFRISKSTRVEKASEMFREHRKLRLPDSNKPYDPKEELKRDCFNEWKRLKRIARSELNERMRVDIQTYHERRKTELGVA